MLQNTGRTISPWRLFDEMMNRASQDLSFASTESAAFPIDVIEHDDHLTVKMSIAGVAPDSVDLTLEGNVLTISAKLDEGNDQNVRYLWRERPTGQVRRVITLPVRLSPDGTDASFNNGVLTVNLKKAPEATAKRIAISAGNQPKAING
jgi:HSP20 family protein